MKNWLQLEAHLERETRCDTCVHLLAVGLILVSWNTRGFLGAL